MKRILSVLLAAIMLCSMFVACGKKDAETVAVTVKVTINSGSSNILKDYEIKVEGENPTALDAILSALDADEITYETSLVQSRVFIEKIDEFDTEDDAYFWELFINDGKKSVSLSTVLNEGDKLVLNRVENNTNTQAVTK